MKTVKFTNKTRYLLLTIILGSLLPLAVFSTNAQAAYTETQSETYSYSNSGFWVETTLHVTLHMTSVGYYFTYSMSHREGKPWFAIWWTPHCYTKLYEYDGNWIAKNFRKVLFFGFIGSYMNVQVWFKESEWKFYYFLEFYYAGNDIFESLFGYLADWYL